MDATHLSDSLQDLMAVFYKRMDSFESKLQGTPLSSSTETIAAEYATFKNFVVMSLRALQEQIHCLAKDMDRLEMRSRRKILLIHGLAEDSQEEAGIVVAKMINDQLQQSTFSVDDIGRCHRMGRAGNSSKPRPILCKFRDVAVRDKVWSAKSTLKGTGITISEFLTKSRHNLFMSARQRYGISKCWTREGNVFILSPDGTRHRVSCQEDLDAITKVVSKTAAVKEATSAKVASSQAKEASAPAKHKRAASRARK